MSKGKTRWFPCSIHPLRHSNYECVVQISRTVSPMLWTLPWDGIGFIVPVPMIVHRWRGQTRRAAALNNKREST